MILSNAHIISSSNIELLISKFGSLIDRELLVITYFKQKHCSSPNLYIDKNKLVEIYNLLEEYERYENRKKMENSTLNLGLVVAVGIVIDICLRIFIGV